jgi:hypothetical protein
MSSAAGRAGTRSAASAKGVDFALFNIQSLNPDACDNERKHGGVVADRRFEDRCMLSKRKWNFTN